MGFGVFAAARVEKDVGTFLRDDLELWTKEPRLYHSLLVVCIY